jgi:hydroxymethylglutaryl-CoA reductase
MYRATTHNKGIFNGIDAVILATGNDFRAIEACGHAYASRNGKYESLSSCEVKDNKFIFSLEIPLAVGTVGGLTKLHPLSKRSLEMLGNPSAKELNENNCLRWTCTKFFRYKSFSYIRHSKRAYENAPY